MLWAFFLLLFFLVPAGLLWLTHHQAWAARMGMILLCYTAGLILGNLGLVPEAVKPLQTGLTDLSIALAMPLLLFTLDVRRWRHVAGKALLSMLFATTAVVTIATTLFFYFRTRGLESADNFAAMAVAVYTGGTPNLAAIKAGLDIPHSQYLVFHTLDTVVGGAYLLLMLTVGIPLFRAILPSFASVSAAVDGPVEDDHAAHDDNFAPFLERANLPELLKSLGLAALVVVAAQGVSLLWARLSGSEPGSAVMIVAITTLGIALSLVPAVARLRLAYKMGMFLIYVFCFVVASIASLGELVNVDPAVAIFMFCTIFGSLLLHCLMCRVLGVDADTFMVTSMAAVGSPPFVPLMARALGNPAVILSGMTTGIICYALGNYLGITLGLLLRGL